MGWCGQLHVVPIVHATLCLLPVRYTNYLRASCLPERLSSDVTIGDPYDHRHYVRGSFR
jgi:hypothetical protein